MIQSLLRVFRPAAFPAAACTEEDGIQKLGYQPEDTTDFIFAVLSAERGFFGAMMTVALYMGIIFVAWQVVRQKRDDFGRMLTFGIASMIGLQRGDQHCRCNGQRADQRFVTPADQRGRKRIDHHLRGAGADVQHHTICSSREAGGGSRTGGRVAYTWGGAGGMRV